MFARRDQEGLAAGVELDRRNGTRVDAAGEGVELTVLEARVRNRDWLAVSASASAPPAPTTPTMARFIRRAVEAGAARTYPT